MLHGAAAVSAAAVFLRGQKTARRLSLLSPARPHTPSGTPGYSMAMHIHSSFSEQTGSMWDQLTQAATNSVDVLWWTDHDHRMDGFRFRKTVHFTGLTETGGNGQGGNWVWQPKPTGPVTSGSAGGIVQTPCSPNDPVNGGAMSLAAQTKTAGKAAGYGYEVNTHPAGWNDRGNLTGQAISIDVLTGSGWSASDGCLELLIGTSYQEASGGRAAGGYSLAYQFVPGSAAATSTNTGNAGVVTIPLSGPGSSTVTVTPAKGGSGWVTVTMHPSEDIQALWPDLPDYRDFALHDLSVYAVSTSGTKVSGYLDYLRFNRSISGQVFYQQQTDMMSAFQSAFPGVTQQQGLEISWRPEHFNWFGPNVQVPSYAGVTQKTYLSYVVNEIIPQIHSSGGLVSWNHPFGFSEKPLLSPAAQEAKLAAVATQWLQMAVPAGNCDLIEVGYVSRAGIDTAHHLGLWDTMSRNAVFLTGNGTSDDHYGLGWRTGDKTGGNNWATSAWSADTTMPNLLAALASGQIWCGSLSEFSTASGASLNLNVDGVCPMGSASVSSLTSRTLTVTATGIPSNGTVQILQGAVDYAGTADPNPDTKVIASLSASDFTGHQATRKIDTSADSFVRVQVLDHNAKIAAAANPIWLFQNPPPNGIPGPRQA